MNEAYLITALVAIFTSITAPIILSLLYAIVRRRDREAEWERQDKRDAEVASRLDVIHTLVNSNLTSAMQGEYDATVRELAMMKEVVDIKRAAGVEPSVEIMQAIVNTEVRVNELNAALIDRLEQAQALAERDRKEGEERRKGVRDRRQVDR